MGLTGVKKTKGEMSGAIICACDYSHSVSPAVSLIDSASNETVLERTFPVGIRILSVNSHVTKLFVSQGTTLLVHCVISNTLSKAIDIGIEAEFLMVNSSGSKFLVHGERSTNDSNNWTVWDVDSGSPLQKLSCNFCPIFSCDDKFIVSFNPQRTVIQVWDDNGLDTGRLASTASYSGAQFSLHPFKPEIVAFWDRSLWVIWDHESNLQVVKSNQMVGTGSELDALAFGNQDDVIYASIFFSRKRHFVALSISTGEELFVIRPEVKCSWPIRYNPTDHSLIVEGSASISPQVLCYSASTGELLQHKKYKTQVRVDVFVRSLLNILL